MIFRGFLSCADLLADSVFCAVVGIGNRDRVAGYRNDLVAVVVGIVDRPIAFRFSRCVFLLLLADQTGIPPLLICFNLEILLNILYW